MTRKAVLDSEVWYLVTNLDLEGPFMTKLDEPGQFPLSGEKSSPNCEQSKTLSMCIVRTVILMPCVIIS